VTERVADQRIAPKRAVEGANVETRAEPDLDDATR
jgi:hypothetical protein